MNCLICNHTERAKIEQALACRSLGDSRITIESIAKEFNVSERELQVHALMHTALPEVSENPEEPTTLTAAIKFKEAEILNSAAQEYYGTLKNLGAKINHMIAGHTDDNPTLFKLSKATVDLYLGLGSEIRNTMDSLVKMNSAIHGDSDEGLKSIGALITAIKISGPKECDSDGD